MRNEPSRTAEAVCLFRATDQRRPPEERIIDDPYARWFLGPLFRAALATVEATGRLAQIAEEFTPGLVAYVLTRHRFIDEAMLDALGSGARQIVILGAGYDTRAYRFHREIAGARVIELDFPATSQRKRQILAEHAGELPSVDVSHVEIDFREESLDRVLAGVGFVPGTPTFFVWEGVSMYLTRQAVQATLHTLAAVGGPKSRVAMDFWFLLDTPDLVATAHRATPSLLHLLGEPMTFSLHPEDAPAFFDRLGYDVLGLADPEELQRRYIRDDRRVYPACYAVHAAARG